jgi:hypothetical protein
VFSPEDLLSVLEMTTADIARVRWAEDRPPRYIADPRVEVDTTLTAELDPCGACSECFACAPKDSVHRITWVQGGIGYHVDVCADPSCADYELKWLLRPRSEPGNHPKEVVFHVRPKLAEVLPGGPRGPVETPQVPVDPEQDDLFLVYDELIQMIRELPNTATVDMSGRDGFLHAQHALMALFAARGINRAEQLRRSA